MRDIYRFDFHFFHLKMLFPFGRTIDEVSHGEKSNGKSDGILMEMMMDLMSQSFE